MHASNCFCGGTGYINCSNCGGSGGKYETEYRGRYRYNGSTGRDEYVSEPERVYRSCGYCSGSGKRPCLDKVGQGKMYEHQFGVISPPPAQTGTVTFWTRLKDELDIELYLDDKRVGTIDKYWATEDSNPEWNQNQLLRLTLSPGMYSYKAISVNGLTWKGQILIQGKGHHTQELIGPKSKGTVTFWSRLKEEIIISVLGEEIGTIKHYWNSKATEPEWNNPRFPRVENLKVGVYPYRALSSTGHVWEGELTITNDIHHKIELQVMSNFIVWTNITNEIINVYITNEDSLCGFIYGDWGSNNPPNDDNTEAKMGKGYLKLEYPTGTYLLIAKSLSSGKIWRKQVDFEAKTNSLELITT